MCGIYAQFGSFTLNDALMCLKKLEYRGYDSYGIGYDNNNIYKDIGRIRLFEEKENKRVRKAICHTRWATNGCVSKENAHPQKSRDGNVVLVHNGILENEKIIRDTYFKDHEFNSQTDSEVIAELINLFLRTNEPFEAVRKVMDVIKGSYAIIFMIKNDSNIYFMKNKSSLIIAYDKEGYYLSSDIYALNKSTIAYKHINDMSYGRIGPDYYYCDNDFIPYDFDFNTCSDSVMLDEIYQEEELALNLYKNHHFCDNLINIVKESKDFVLIGSGSSFYAAEYIAKMIELKLEKRAKAFLPTEFEYNDLYAQSTYIFISQSGETADVLNIIENIKTNKKILLTNNPSSQMALHVPNVIDIKAQREVAVASTKSFNQSVLAFYLLLMKVNNEEADEIYAYIKNLEEIKKVFNHKKIETISKMKCVFYLGQGFDYIISKEGALKLKEIAYIPTEGYSTSELKHGSLALISCDTMVIGLSSKESFLTSSLNEVKARGGNVLFLNTKYPSKLLGALALVRYVQLIAYYVAVELKLDPEHPRNLAKSVTVI